MFPDGPAPPTGVAQTDCPGAWPAGAVFDETSPHTLLHRRSADSPPGGGKVAPAPAWPHEKTQESADAPSRLSGIPHEAPFLVQHETRKKLRKSWNACARTHTNSPRGARSMRMSRWVKRPFFSEYARRPRNPTDCMFFLRDST